MAEQGARPCSLGFLFLLHLRALPVPGLLLVVPGASREPESPDARGVQESAGNLSRVRGLTLSRNTAPTLTPHSLFYLEGTGPSLQTHEHTVHKKVSELATSSPRNQDMLQAANFICNGKRTLHILSLSQDVNPQLYSDCLTANSALKHTLGSQ